MSTRNRARREGEPRPGDAAGRPMTHLRLSPRQREVLRARCETGSRKDAAALLRIHVRTVEYHLERITCCRDDAQACFAHHAELDVSVLISPQ